MNINSCNFTPGQYSSKGGGYYPRRLQSAVKLLMILLLPVVFGCSQGGEGEKASRSTMFADARVRKLVLASEAGDIRTIESFIRDNVDVNYRGRANNTPLLCVLLAKNKEGFHALLEHGADPNLLNDQGVAVMNEAALDPDPSWLAEALKHGGNPNLVNKGNRFFPGATPIHYAISKGRTENVKLLVAAKARIDQKDDEKDFPLLMAARKPAYDIVLLLLHAGADFKQTDAHGDDLVQWVSRRNANFVPENQRQWFFQTVDFLKEKGARLNLLNE